MLSKKLKNLAPYAPYEPNVGEYRIRLDANESCFNIDGDLKSRLAEEFLRLDYNVYPDPYAVAATEAFAGFYDFNPKYAVAGNGSDEIIGNIINLFTDGKICILSDDFSMYKIYAQLFGKDVKVFQKNADLTVDTEKLSVFCQDVSLLIFSNPCNPTSLGIEREQIRKLILSLPDTLIVLDEAYMDFWGESLLPEIDEYPNLIILKTCSKIGMAAIRFGFAISSNSEFTRALRAVKAPYNTNSISQKTAEVLFSEKKYLRSRISEIIKYTRNLCEELSKIFETVYDTKTNFVFIKTQKAEEVYKKLLERSIALRCFGEYLRITTGTPAVNAVLLKELRNIC